MFPPKIDLGICNICKGAGLRKDSDYTNIDCICNGTGNKFFLYEPNKEKRIFDKINEGLIGREYIKIDYKDKWLFDKIKYRLEFGMCHYYGEYRELYINSLNRLEPFYSNNDYNLLHYSFPPLEDPLFPFKRK